MTFTDGNVSLNSTLSPSTLLSIDKTPLNTGYIDVPVLPQEGVVVAKQIAHQQDPPDEDCCCDLSPTAIPQVDGCNLMPTSNKNSGYYPTLLCTNVRSLIPKLDCLCSTIEQEEVAIAFVSELWLQGSNPLHQQALDRRLNLEGLEFFTNY